MDPEILPPPSLVLGPQGHQPARASAVSCHHFCRQYFLQGVKICCGVSRAARLSAAARCALDANLGVKHPQRDTVFLLQFDPHDENIRWFWACIVAGYLPCIVPKFAISTGCRRAQAKQILRLPDDPVILTNSCMTCAFQGVNSPSLYLVDQQSAWASCSSATASTPNESQPTSR
ncbi:hypothetical protein AbraIFM66950_007759 [Aspergillus brasiliensis]|nr:hypothetical protein AbraIFM66950_007759 [Aspergillus brasiliensis]